MDMVVIIMEDMTHTKKTKNKQKIKNKQKNKKQTKKQKTNKKNKKQTKNNKYIFVIFLLHIHNGFLYFFLLKKYVDILGASHRCLLKFFDCYPFYYTIYSFSL